MYTRSNQRSVASSFGCRERNYTARARGNRCSSENIQEATSWAGNTTLFESFDDRREREGSGKEDVLCRSQVAKWIENFPPKLLLLLLLLLPLLLLPFPRWRFFFFFFFTLCIIFHIPFFTDGTSVSSCARNFQVFSVEPPFFYRLISRDVVAPPTFSHLSIIVFENDGENDEI